MTDAQFYQEVVCRHVGQEVRFLNARAAAGGRIHQAYRLDTSAGAVFIKWRHGDADIFEKEAAGLNLLKPNTSLLVPASLAWGTLDGKAYLLLEFIQAHPPNPDFWEQFAEGLAMLHRTSTHAFGLDHDNYIGRLSQINEWRPDFITFFIECRIEPQVKLAVDSGLLTTSHITGFKNLFNQLPSIFPTEKSALLHGDLWSGNFMIGPNGQAVLIDPAVYFGHREMELAFTKMFGGFDDRFYEAYQKLFPMVPGYEQRFEIYNLYPLLVHLNLFGRSYLSGIERVLKSF
jgi:protein-ribulosamine 3-kinase